MALDTGIPASMTMLAEVAYESGYFLYLLLYWFYASPFG